jgi:hypothetical protein
MFGIGEIAFPQGLNPLILRVLTYGLKPVPFKTDAIEFFRSL